MQRNKKQQERKKESGAFCNARFGTYEGEKRFEVEHPSHPRCVVAAPDEASALVAAAEFNGLKWNSYSYYAYAKVVPSTQS